MPTKCQGCPRTDSDEWCPGQVAPVVCHGKDTTFKTMFENDTDDSFRIKTKMPETKPLKLNERLEICKACTHYDNGRCKLCGCDLGKKTAIEHEHCPISKW